MERALILTPPFEEPHLRMEVRTHVSTGTNPLTRSGVFGVIDRDQVRALRNLLTDFLLDFPDHG